MKAVFVCCGKNSGLRTHGKTSNTNRNT